ncbi:hypothetical protein ANN_15934, partial [Periplaneta americana]
MAGLCEGGNGPAGSLKAICISRRIARHVNVNQSSVQFVEIMAVDIFNSCFKRSEEYTVYYSVKCLTNKYEFCSKPFLPQPRNSTLLRYGVVFTRQDTKVNEAKGSKTGTTLQLLGGLQWSLLARVNAIYSPLGLMTLRTDSLRSFEYCDRFDACLASEWL